MPTQGVRMRMAGDMAAGESGNSTVFPRTSGVAVAEVVSVTRETPSTVTVAFAPASPLITVKHVPGGKVSDHFIRRLEPGERFRVSQAQGNFMLPDSRPALLPWQPAGKSGIVTCSYPQEGRRSRCRARDQ